MRRFSLSRQFTGLDGEPQRKTKDQTRFAPGRRSSPTFRLRTLLFMMTRSIPGASLLD